LQQGRKLLGSDDLLLEQMELRRQLRLFVAGGLQIPFILAYYF